MVALYRSVGEELSHYELDVDREKLTQRSGVRLPARVQYVWPHPSKRYLYVASSSGGPRASGNEHYLDAFRIEPAGALQPHGDGQSLPYRPIHLCVDATGGYIVTAYNNPSSMTVHRIAADGTIAAEVKQAVDLDTGIFAHQVRFTPSNAGVILVTRGNNAAPGKAEDPGALKLFRFRDGLLTNLASIAPAGGYGFGPRHLDFHPTQPWVYVSLERQNKIQLYTLQGERLSAEPVFTKDTLQEPANVRPRQLGGTIHVHPNGRFVYVANRADYKVDFSGTAVFGGGENSIVVYAIDPRTGEPQLIQHIEPGAFHVRTFAIDPSGRLLVAASIIPMTVRDGSKVANVPAGLSMFRIGDDGKLEFVRKYDVETGDKTQFWMGIV
jgi:6-phosphogluconolactonase